MMSADNETDETDESDPIDVFKDENDLTNRFKYKVNALMGSYDPPQGDTDTERTDGNILGALLNFPTTYSFTVVGRTGGDDSVRDAYVEDVRSVVLDRCGTNRAPTRDNENDNDNENHDDDEDQPSTEQVDVVQAVEPRGENFVRITVEVTVESAAMISEVYDGLGALERTVMRF